MYDNRLFGFVADNQNVSANMDFRLEMTSLRVRLASVTSAQNTNLIHSEVHNLGTVVFFPTFLLKFVEVCHKVLHCFKMVLFSVFDLSWIYFVAVQYWPLWPLKSASHRSSRQLQSSWNLQRSLFCDKISRFLRPHYCPAHQTDQTQRTTSANHSV